MLGTKHNISSSTTTTTTTLMLPSQPHPHPPQTSKRKAPPDDPNPLLNGTAAKRMKKELGKTGSSSSKRKLINGEEMPGGLLIVRAGSTQPSSQPSSQPSHSQSQHDPTRAPSRPPSFQPSQPPSQSTKPPAKKFKADHLTQPLPGNSSYSLAPQNGLGKQVDEDVRRMDSETDDLRRASRSYASSSTSALNIPTLFESSQPPVNKSKSGKSHPPRKSRADPGVLMTSTSEPLPTSETPIIQRNRALREPPPSSHRRRSSVGRGKRNSQLFATTGLIALPHSTIGDESFYKQIDEELPPGARIRTLMTWCAGRAAAASSPSSAYISSSASGSSTPVLPAVPLPEDLLPLPEEDSDMATKVRDALVKLLGEGQIDVTSHMFASAVADDVGTKPNPQNVRNRMMKAVYETQITRAEAEERAWTDIEHQHKRRLADLARIYAITSPPAPGSSSKAKGKQRAPPEDDYEPRVDELPRQLRGAVELAHSVLAEAHSKRAAQDQTPTPTELEERLLDLRFKIDSLRLSGRTALKAVRVIEADLDLRFGRIGRALAVRSGVAVPGLGGKAVVGSGATGLDVYLPLHHQPQPSSSSRPPPTKAGVNPQTLLAALSHVDAQRPPTQVGDEVRRAKRQVQRVLEGGSTEGRRLTLGANGGIPNTPRKVPSTPGRERL